MTKELAVIAAVVVAILIFVPTVRRIVKVLVIVAITLGASAIALVGLAILLNNVAVNDQPGMASRIQRFLTVDWAATSTKGTSLATCHESAAGAAVHPGSEAPAAAEEARQGERHAGATQPAASPSPAGAAGNPEEDVYPELVRRGYPGLSRAKLFALAKETIGDLGGWRIVKEDARSYTLECICTSRVLRSEDQVTIVVTPRSEIDLCSHSGVGEPGGNAFGRLFSGDFGANIGHIKEFYLALEPRVDQAYKEQERKRGDAG